MLINIVASQQHKPLQCTAGFTEKKPPEFNAMESRYPCATKRLNMYMCNLPLMES